MLVLSRKPGEKIVIGDNIVLTVIEICRGKVRLGIEAPKDVKVMRDELLTDGLPTGEKPRPSEERSYERWRDMA